MSSFAQDFGFFDSGAGVGPRSDASLYVQAPVWEFPWLHGAMGDNMFCTSMNRHSAELWRYFNYATLGNDSLPWKIAPTAAGQYNWLDLDQCLGYLRDSGKHVRLGHFTYLPDWVYGSGGQESPDSWAAVSARLETLVYDMTYHCASKFPGTVTAWNFVNEICGVSGLDHGIRTNHPLYIAAAQGGGDGWRFVKVIHDACRAALAAAGDTTCKLVWAEFGHEWNQAYTDAHIAAVNYARTNKLLTIDALGAQYHVARWIPPANLAANTEYLLTQAAASSVKVRIIELDFSCIDGEEPDVGYPYVPPGRLVFQADQATAVFSALFAHQDSVEEVTWWGLDDGYSFLNYLNGAKHDAPLPFDRFGRPKPIWWAINPAEFVSE